MSDRQRGIGVAKWRWSYPRATLPYHAETMGKRGSRYDEANKQPSNAITVATSLRACIAPITIRVDVVQAVQVVQVVQVG